MLLALCRRGKIVIYMDYMATAPVDPRVAKKMCQCLDSSGCFGNPSSNTHRYGWEAAELVNVARQQVADLIHADPREIIWTSGATESNNLAIKGAAYFYQRKGKHLITAATEHKSVLEACQFLKTQGFELTILKPQQNALLDLNELKKAIRPDTILISIMHVNNELGVIQDIASIGKIAHEQGVLFHVDAAQGAGKLPIDLALLDVDLMSFSSHKIYGPKGMGALYVRRNPRVRLVPLIHGGGQERGMRSGTLATHQIVGMGEAFAIAKEQGEKEHQRIAQLRERFWKGISSLSGVHLNGDAKMSIPGCLNISFDGVDSESLLLRLRDLALSSGSACSSASSRASHVLQALHLPIEQSRNALRFSIGRFTTEEEINQAVAMIQDNVSHLREMSPLWG